MGLAHPMKRKVTDAFITLWGFRVGRGSWASIPPSLGPGKRRNRPQQRAPVCCCGSCRADHGRRSMERVQLRRPWQQCEGLRPGRSRRRRLCPKQRRQLSIRRRSALDFHGAKRWCDTDRHRCIPGWRHIPGVRQRQSDRHTSAVPTAGNCGSDPVPCLADTSLSHGVFNLGPGAHSITIKMLASPFNSGAVVPPDRQQARTFRLLPDHGSPGPAQGRGDGGSVRKGEASRRQARADLRAGVEDRVEVGSSSRGSPFCKATAPLARRGTSQTHPSGRQSKSVRSIVGSNGAFIFGAFVTLTR